MWSWVKRSRWAQALPVLQGRGCWMKLDGLVGPGKEWLGTWENKVLDVDGTKVKLQMWDTAGQERFRSVTHAYYRDAHALLLLYDVTNKASFDNIQDWLSEIQEHAQRDVVLMLLGNKVDSTHEREVKREDGEKLAKLATAVCRNTGCPSWRPAPRAASTWTWLSPR
ncbi:ras-related protein Rab-26 isoform X3 [Echinops telfairi]|uniref:Ras-related protein Rab-26 isoform X3 n=1 Tax=Echinops telfairi TaxID=9371 RepID=A0AC55CRA3_ECHTE|nr:ras-related protein Rab-26 isoform X3 [Echinops telfairi]